MKTFRFRDFTIYQAARAFRKKVEAHLKKFPSSEKYCLIDQIHRSCLSILLNIAEGSAKNTDKDFARYLDNAVGSLNEVIAGFDAAVDDGLLTVDTSKALEADAEILGKQMGSFIQRLRRKLPLATSHLPHASK